MMTAFKNWLSKQDNNEQIDFAHPRDCLLARFLNSLNLGKASVGAWTYYVGDTFGDIPKPIAEKILLLIDNNAKTIKDAKQVFGLTA